MKFNLTRFINLIKRDYIIHRKALIFICLGFWGLIAIILGINWASGDAGYIHSDFWVPIMISMLFIVGLTFTAIVFRDFKTPAGRIQFLSLPASNFEKIFSRWIYSLILFPLFIVLSVWIPSLITITEGPGLFGLAEDNMILAIVGGFVMLHAITFLYSMFFNTLVPIKVMLLSTLVTMVTAFVVMCLAVIIFGEYFEIGQGLKEDVIMSRSGESFFKHTVESALEIILIFILVPFLWIVSYFKMKEKEA